MNDDVWTCPECNGIYRLTTGLANLCCIEAYGDMQREQGEPVDVPLASHIIDGVKCSVQYLRLFAEYDPIIRDELDDLQQRLR